ncbi:MAG: GNAT family N-acetyltransferase [Deltaproteobacteria bacterium]|nr:GNAT family N-acetyltransferase [Candidatus Zymogenaceae bacterium]
MTADDIVIEVLTDGDIKKATALLKDVFGETDAQKRSLLNETFYRWQYEETKSPVVIAHMNGEIVGHYPLTTYRLVSDGAPLKAAVIQDLVTRSDMRGRGVFRRMGDWAVKLAGELGYDLIYAFPNHRSFPGFITHHGYRHHGDIRLRVSPLSPSRVLAAKLPLTFLTRILRPLDRLCLSFFKKKGGNLSITEHSELTDDTKASLDRLWERAGKHIGTGLVRDGAYLDWRFFRRPGGDYTLIIARSTDGETQAYAVVGRGAFFGLSCGVLMDMACAPTDAGRRALGAVISRSRSISERHGAALMLTLTNRFGTMLFRCGFFPVPHAMNPRRLRLVVRSLSDGAKRAGGDRARWYITPADWDVL